MNRVVLAAPRRVAQVAVRFVLDLEFSFFGVKNFINIFIDHSPSLLPTAISIPPPNSLVPVLPPLVLLDPVLVSNMNIC